MSRQAILPPDVAAPGRNFRLPSIRSQTAVIALAVAISSLAAGPLLAQHPLVTLPMEDPAYEQLAALERTGCAPGRVSAYRPFIVQDVRDALARAARDSSCAPRIVAALQRRFAADTFDIFTDAEGNLYAGAALTARATQLSKGEFRPFWRGVRPTEEGDPPFAAVAQGRITWGSPSVVAVAEVAGYTHRRNDPLVHQRAVRRTTGAIDFGESYLNARLGQRLTLSFGRVSEAWLGEGRESLLLSAWGPSLDRLTVAGRWRRVEGRAMLGSLASVELTPEQDSLPAARRFYRQFIAHALTIRPSRALELTLGESVLLARGTQTLELAYANPLMAYVVTQNDTSRYGAGQNDNLQIFGSARVRSGGSVFQAELLVDDVQIDARDRKRVQDQLAWSFRGTQSIPLVVPASAVAEYRHVNSYAYLRNSYATAYQNYDAPIGSELGPDSDLWRAGGELWPSGTMKLSGGVTGWRQGAQRLDQRPGRNSNDHAGEPFPSVTTDRPYVQRAVILDAGVSYLGMPLTVTVRAEGARISNAGNQLVAAASYVRLQLIGRYAYHIP